tara:strand:- start:5635 stop:6702 length:1068 start_codon:yes stop_codon:yes gene_type:complete
LELQPGITVLWGDNAQGKTNLLEAAYVLATLKSFRSARNAELIRSTKDQATIQGQLMTADLPRTCTVEISSKGKRSRIDGKAPSSLPDYFDAIKAISFVPSDLRLIDGPPEARRNFLDRAAFTMNPQFLDVAREYRTALRQKNALLRQERFIGSGSNRDLLAVWNERLVASGSLIVQHRLRFLAEFSPVFNEVHQSITRSTRGRIELRYRACISEQTINSGLSSIRSEMQCQIDRAAPEETKRGFAVWGPHRDDWTVRVGDQVLRRFGSQGQLRSAALALRVAQMLLAKRKSGNCPLFLLDDVSSELDPHRNGQLMALLRELEAQVLITTTDPVNLRLEGEEYEPIKVVNGTISR